MKLTDEEIMMLADAYANAAQGYNMATLNKARAALEAALSAKQGEQERISELEAECERLNQQAELQYQHDTKEIEELQAQNAQLLEALTSIAKNSCCDSCQEAARVARAAIAAVEGKV